MDFILGLKEAHVSNIFKVHVSISVLLFLALELSCVNQCQRAPLKIKNIQKLRTFGW